MSAEYFAHNHRLSRRRFAELAAAAGLGLAGLRYRAALAQSAATAPPQAAKTGVDPSKWNPEAINAMAGTLKVDTKAELAKVTPLDHKGKLTFWYAGPNDASPDIDKKIDKEFWDAWNQFYPNIPLKVGDTVQNLDYNQMLDKVRTAAAGNAAPDVARMPILWGVEFAAKGQLREVQLEEFGFTKEQFWPGALKSVTWDGKLYGVPTNNETMAFIWNKQIFEKAGLDPNKAPATWDDVVSYSKQIAKETGKKGYGLVARVNAGNTPFRFMPALWAYGSGALDEAEPEPTYQKVLINNEGGIAALQAHYDMYVRDRSVPSSALTNTQTENGDLFISGQIAMEISHPSEYAAMIDKANKATGSDKKLADEVVGNMAYGLLPAGPVRRAVVFGGSNIHIFTDKAAGNTVDQDAARALVAMWCSPEWATKQTWDSSNPGNLDGFKTEWMKQRLQQIKFLDVTTSMLPYGIPFPVIPESTQIMNIIVPEMLQNALTRKMKVKEAADDAADKIKALLAKRSS